MPLHLEDFFNSKESEFFPESIIFALLEIEEETVETAITPLVAWGCVRRHLRPLLSKSRRKIFDALKVRSWQSYFFSYATLLRYCKKKDDQVRFVARAINIVFVHSTLPPRSPQFPKFIEVTYFLNSCTHLKIELPKLIEVDHIGNAEVFRFCKYCWRIALANRDACPVHSPGKDLGNMDLPNENDLKPLSQAARYKLATRQRKKFDATILDRLNTELQEFHESNFKSQFLMPILGCGHWLSIHRPNVWSYLNSADAKINDHKIPLALIDLLHNPENLGRSIKPTYLSANELMRENPVLMWPMLLRAESWLSVRKDEKNKWGGLRLNAGSKQAL